MSLGLTDPGLVSCRLGDEGGYRPYFENYTVDASILDSTERSDHINNNNFLIIYGEKVHWSISTLWCCDRFLYSCDINFLRANGGCLGIWSRRRTYKSAISLGELIIEL